MKDSKKEKIGGNSLLEGWIDNLKSRGQPLLQKTKKKKEGKRTKRKKKGKK